MGLSDIAADVEVTAEQRDRGVATVDETAADLPERLAPVADDLPCDAEAAAALVEAYTGGASVGGAGDAVGLPSLTAAKTLHRLGVEGVCPLASMAREIVGDWIAGECSRTEARELAGATETEFLLAAYVATHDPIPAAREAVEPVLGPGGESPGIDDRLGDAMPDADEFL